MANFGAIYRRAEKTAPSTQAGPKAAVAKPTRTATGPVADTYHIRSEISSRPCPTGANEDRVNEGQAYQNVKMYSDPQNAWIEHNAALKKQITAIMKDSSELYKKYTEDQTFHDDLNEMIVNLTYQPGKGG